MQPLAPIAECCYLAWPNRVELGAISTLTKNLGLFGATYVFILCCIRRSTLHRIQKNKDSWQRQSTAQSFGPLHSEATLAFGNSNDFSDVSWVIKQRSEVISEMLKEHELSLMQDCWWEMNTWNRIYGSLVELEEDIKCTRKSIHPANMSGINASIHRCMYIWVEWMVVRYPHNRVHCYTSCTPKR